MDMISYITHLQNDIQFIQSVVIIIVQLIQLMDIMVNEDEYDVHLFAVIQNVHFQLMSVMTQLVHRQYRPNFYTIMEMGANQELTVRSGIDTNTLLVANRYASSFCISYNVKKEILNCALST